MDKYEYKLRLEEIRTLNRKGRFQEAAQVADTVDWKKVRNISTLGIISDVYKVNRRFEDAKEILLLANEKSPQNRRILYSLCDLTVKMGQVVEAVEFYKEFVQLAPNDNSKYILLYKIYEAQDISLEERIAVLKEYKKREYSEKWAYELAFLYHRLGLSTECVEECDQLILWFGEGKYVTKAMELKRLYVPLSPAQQQAYDRQFGKREEPVPEPPAAEEQEPVVVPEQKPQEEELDIQVKTMDMGQYNTLNLQAALAESLKEVLEPEQEARQEQRWEQEPAVTEEAEQFSDDDEDLQQFDAPQPGRVVPESGMRRIEAQQQAYGGDDAEYQEDVSKVMQDSENWDAQGTGQLETEEEESAEEQPAQEEETVAAFAEQSTSVTPVQTEMQEERIETALEQPIEKASEKQTKAGSARVRTARMESFLAQEYDGQISLALPEEKAVEKQITGQMNIEDVLAEWELLKKKNEEKRKQETKQWILQQTGSMFEDFDQLSKDGVLEKLQREESLLNDEVKPTPANAAARVAMAAQGMLEKPEAKPQEKDPESLKREAAEALMREAIAKQREAQALLDEIAREKQKAVTEIEAVTEVEVAPETEAEVGVEATPETEAEAVGDVTPEAEAEIEEQEEVGKTQRLFVETMQQLMNIGAVEEAVPEAEMPSAEATEPEAVQRTEGSAEVTEAEMAEEAPETETPSAEAEVAEAVRQAETENGIETTEAKIPEMAPRQAAEAAKKKDGGNSDALNERIREQQYEEHERSLTPEEKEIFSSFVATKAEMRQLVKALDTLSLSAYTGNMIITGAPGADMMKLAKNLILKVRESDRNFSGKVAKISGDVLGTRNVDNVVTQLPNGALIIEKGGKLSDDGIAKLLKALNQEQTGIIVFLLDRKRAVEALLERSPQLENCFTARFDIAALDTGKLVKYGCQYAYNMEYSIDELGRLALHTRIDDMQTRDHAVTTDEVREIVDEAIEHAEKFSLHHFWDILLRRRYDEEDMIILRERDFI